MDGLYCFVRTWEGRSLKQVCVLVEDKRQPAPDAELTCLARVKASVTSDKLPVCVRGGSAVLGAVIAANRDDSRRAVSYRAFTDETFLKCYRLAHVDSFGMVDILSLLEYLMLRLRTATQELWMADCGTLLSCIDAGRFSVLELRQLCVELLSVWSDVRHYVRNSGPLRSCERSDAVSFSFSRWWVML